MEAHPRPYDDRKPDDRLLDEEEQERNRRLELERTTKRRLEYLKADREARARLRAEDAAGGDFDSQYLTRGDLDHLPRPEPLIDRVIPRHAYGILRGRDHSFKSFVALDWACCLATGKPWQEHPAEQARVLYIAGEGAHGLAQRIDSWEYAWRKKIPDDMLTIRQTALNMHQPGPAYDHLLDHVTAGGYELVIIDTLRRVSGAADGNSSEMGAVVDNIDRLKNATRDGTVLAVAHTDKGDHDTRGYSGIEDDADFIWSARRDHSALTLKLTKMKDGPDNRELILEAKPADAGSLVLQGIAGQPTIDNTENEQKILTALQELDIDGVTPAVILEATGLKRPTAYRALKNLHKANLIVNLGSDRKHLWGLPRLPVEIGSSHGRLTPTSHDVSPCLTEPNPL